MAYRDDQSDRLGLVPYRVDLETGLEIQPSRGIGNSWIALFAPDLWPEEAERWYAVYERHFWQERGWASGFREYARGGEEGEWTFEIDAGPVLDGFGTSANAFAVAAARRNGRFDHAYTLSTQLVATSWPLPDGTLLLPRGASHAADAPYLGESAIAYFLTVLPAEGVEIVEGGEITALVAFPLAVYFGISALVFAWVFRAVRRHFRSRSEERSAAPGLQLGIAGAYTLGAAMLFLQGSPLFAAALLLVGQIALFRRGASARA